jgi:hypothetical protein
MSRLLDAAKRYTKAGQAVIPLWPDSRKNPHLSTFEEFCHRLPTELEWARWARSWPDANIGLITGYWQNYVCLDFDDLLTYDVWSKKWGQKTAASMKPVSPQTWMVQTRRGYHVWFQTRQEAGKSRIFTKDGLEVLCRAKGGYCIVPPSIHHTGTSYKTVCNVLPMIVESVADILPGWKEKTGPQGDVMAERSLQITPTKVKIENLIPPIKEHPSTRGAYLAKCPFHDDQKPSAWVNIEEQRFGCNACWPGLWWDVVNVYAMLRSISNGEAYKLLRRAA